MADEQNDNPLELFTLDELAAELDRRYEGFVFIGSVARNSAVDRIQIRRGGSFVGGMGLCEYAKQWMIAHGDFMEDEKVDP